MVQKQRRYVTAVLIVVSLAGAAGGAVAAAHQGGGAVVTATGKESQIIQRNTLALFVSTFHFSPGTISVQSGETVTFKNETKDLHTMTLARSRKDLPGSAEAPCKPCEVARGHLKNPRNEESGIKSYVLNKGQTGLDTFGDSVAITPKGPHKTATIVVSAPAGTTLYYVCAIHPWMQASIKVT